MIPLETLFERFCRYMNGKRRWSDKDADWTATVGEFLELEAKVQTPDLQYVEEHLRIDFIWRRPAESLVGQIELAVEHENVTRELRQLLDSELQHLLDIKAVNKIGIFYINRVDQNDFLDQVEQRIRRQWLRFDIERYLVVLGYTVSGRKQIELVGTIFDSKGSRLDRQLRRVVAQAS